jgi:acetylornithine deacetylase/succinyl-diaminopimelate desuccinylase-like protein
MIFCLDCIAPDYNRLWLTTSLRGVMVMELKIQCLEKGMHSGKGSGLVADSFRILRNVLSRIEEYDDLGNVRVPDLEVPITTDIIIQALNTVNAMGADNVGKDIPLLDGVKLMSKDPVDLIINNTWKPTLTVLGQDGMPATEIAGNVLRPYTTLKLGFRLPPTKSASEGYKAIRDKLLADPIDNCDIEIPNFDAKDGFLCPDLKPSMKSLFNTVSKAYFDGQDCCNVGLGGSIGLMKMLQNVFPNSLFVLTGAAGSDSNAHGPNESLKLDYARRFICALAHFISGLTFN